GVIAVPANGHQDAAVGTGLMLVLRVLAPGRALAFLGLGVGWWGVGVRVAAPDGAGQSHRDRGKAKRTEFPWHRMLLIRQRPPTHGGGGRFYKGGFSPLPLGGRGVRGEGHNS